MGEGSVGLSPSDCGEGALFWFNAMLIASNGTDSRIGSLTADGERMVEWKRIERGDEARRVTLEVMRRDWLNVRHSPQMGH